MVSGTTLGSIMDPLPGRGATTRLFQASKTGGSARQSRRETHEIATGEEPHGDDLGPNPARSTIGATGQRLGRACLERRGPAHTGDPTARMVGTPSDIEGSGAAADRDPLHDHRRGHRRVWRLAAEQLEPASSPARAL